MEKVSIVIPVYNAEKYLNECINSILNQTYANMEILLIDDGSTDKSSSICDMYCQKYKDIIVYHLNNGGVSKARNYGIEKATGEFIIFVDSDDIIDKYMVEKMVFAIKEKSVDLAICGYKYLYKNEIINSKIKHNGYMTIEQAKREIFLPDSIKGYSVNKIYKREVLLENNIRFEEKIKICEDMLFVFKYIHHINKIYVVNDDLYYYRMRKTSASNQGVESDLTVFEALKSIYKLDNRAIEYSKGFYCFLYFKYLRVLKKTGKIKIVPKIKLIDVLVDKKIDNKKKVFILYYLMVPKFLRIIVKDKKQKKYKYYD